MGLLVGEPDLLSVLADARTGPATLVANELPNPKMDPTSILAWSLRYAAIIPSGMAAVVATCYVGVGLKRLRLIFRPLARLQPGCL